MQQLDKARFGTFVAQRRRAKGMTQKNLAERLCVSDKAVSKWETGVSLPDVALLAPLAEQLEVTVSELLAGQPMPELTVAPARVEALVQQAIAYSDEVIRRPGLRNKRRAALFLGCVLLSLVELTLLALGGVPLGQMGESLLVPLLLAGAFGVYFWFFAQEQLPRYYDENRISAYSDGFFRMNLPGVAFNNRNWPHILAVCRGWSAVSLVAYPQLWFGANCLLPRGWARMGNLVLMVLLLAGLFVPVTAAGRKTK